MGRGIRNDVAAKYISPRLPKCGGEEAAAQDTVSLFAANLTSGELLEESLSSLAAETEAAELSSARSAVAAAVVAVQFIFSRLLSSAQNR